jgi:beta-xylosidase
VTRSSVGVQAEPEYVSMSTQVSTQTYTNCVSTSIQVYPEFGPQNASSTQTEDDRKYTGLDVQIDASSMKHNLQDQSYLTTVRLAILSIPMFYQF